MIAATNTTNLSTMSIPNASELVCIRPPVNCAANASSTRPFLQETPFKPEGNTEGQIAVQKDDNLPRPDKTREAETSDPSFKEEPLVKGPSNFGDGTSVFKGGFAQETLNGRAAMVGFTSAVRHVF